MQRLLPGLVLAALLMSVVAVSTSIGQSSTAARQPVRWEYRVAEGDIDFNRLGAEGWELVTVYPGFKQGIYAYFKRPLR